MGNGAEILQSNSVELLRYAVVMTLEFLKAMTSITEDFHSLTYNTAHVFSRLNFKVVIPYLKVS